MTSSSIRFFEESSLRLKHKRKLREWIAKTIDAHRFQLELLSIILVDDKNITGLNKTYLKHKGPTDVITFQYNAKGEPIDGEIFLSIETVAENAHRFKTSFEEELHRVMIHGVLHLLGYSDKTASARQKMSVLEDEQLALLGQTLRGKR